MADKKPESNAPGAAVQTAGQGKFEQITSRINSLLDDKAIDLPSGYSATNAMRSAFLMFQDQKVKVNTPEGEKEFPVLEICSQASIANSLMKMVVQGMNPAKQQCYFIPYRTKSGSYELNYQRSFGGSYALAKRVKPEMTEITGAAIYKDDIFSFGVDAKTGRKYIIEHTPKLENQIAENVIGAYAIVNYADGTSSAVVKSMPQIRKAWEQGATKGASPAHKNFTDEMAIKTVISSACKLLIMASNDVDIDDEDETTIDTEHTTVSKQRIEIEANREEVILPIQEAEVILSGAIQKEEVEKPKENGAAPLFA